MSQLDIPFNRSSLLGRDLEYIFQTMTIGQIAGDQTYSKKCHALLKGTMGVPKAFVTTSWLRLPFFCSLTDAEQMRVIEAVRQFKP